ncbi:MAG: hypothetical protein PHG79_07305 [Methanosarcina sp.]|jgi:hypothetical protein|nr:hypothetical protein [Methanosarcina sp.]
MESFECFLNLPAIQENSTNGATNSSMEIFMFEYGNREIAVTVVTLIDKYQL